MPLTDRERVRRDIQDKPAEVTEQFVGDGAQLVYVLSRPNPSDVVVTTATGMLTATVSGARLTLSATTDEIFDVFYTSAVFSDDDIDDWLANEGSVDGAILRGIRAQIMGDYSMFRAPDGTSVDNRLRQQQLVQMYRELTGGQNINQPVPAGRIITPC